MSNDSVRNTGPTVTAEATGAALTSAGAATAAAAAVACCVPVVSPLLVTVLGASGAVWVTGLKPYSPYLLLGSLLLLILAFLRAYRPVGTCLLGVAGSGLRGFRPPRARFTRVLLWFSTLVWLVGVIAYIVWN